eukprot:515577-Karenia_brevis.AAC.1
MDGWGSGEFKLFSDLVFLWLSKLLTLVEKGHPWPNQLLHHRSALLLKDPESPTFALSYRILKIMPILYRRWAATRLADLGPWIDSWAEDSMFAGVPGRSAEDAWYITSLEAEHAQVTTSDFLGGALDLYKCFDQVIRMLLYVVLLLAGLPHCVLSAYINYHENAFSYFVFNGMYGKAHRFVCGIPQGCPLSMLFIAILLRPWAKQIRVFSPQAKPRALADDILLLVVGPGALALFSQAFLITIQHLMDLGGGISAHKSL